MIEHGRVVVSGWRMAIFVEITTVMCLFIQICSGYLSHVEYGASPVPPGFPWPLPKIWKNSTTLMTIKPEGFKFSTSITGCDVLDNAVKRYRSIIFPQEEQGIEDRLLRVIIGVHVTINSKKCDYSPSLHTTESYELKVYADSIVRIQSKNVWGALRGLATFSQLIWKDVDKKYRINHTEISDSPRFPHRGILIDTSRHYIPVPVILRNIEAMEYNKFNVLHWLMVDDDSFPFESETFPELHREGAYSSYHTYPLISVVEVIEYARLRGIRVIPELGSPTHTHSWGHSHPEIMLKCEDTNTSLNVLNPASNATYKFLSDLYTEIAEVFPDNYIHVGMKDFQIAKSCWSGSKTVHDFMNEQGHVLMSQQGNYYVTRLQELIKKTNKDLIVWEDPLDIGVNKLNRGQVIIQVYKHWKRDPVGTVVRQAYRVIVSTCWQISPLDPADAWRKDYHCDPHDFSGSKLDYEYVLGGEVLQWGRSVGSSNFFNNLWPRASAAAERLWSPKDQRNAAETMIFRLEEQRCRMILLGIPSSPVIPGFCEREYEGYFKQSSGGQHCSTSIGVIYVALACFLDALSQLLTGHDVQFKTSKN